MKNKKYFLLFLLTALLCALFLSGCEMLRKEDSQEEEGRFSVFYTNAEHTKLVEKKYTPSEETFEGMLREMLSVFQHPEDEDLVSVIPEGVKINGYTIGVDNLIVDFSGSYIGMSNVEEVLARSGLVKTLVQLPGIYSISMTVDGQPLTESGSGLPVGSMRADTFVDIQDDSMYSYQLVTLSLYYPARDGSGLGLEKREAFYSSDIIMERFITEQLLRGPENSALLAAALPTVQINSVRIADNICIIDLDGTFQQKPNQQVSSLLCLYAFVNSIFNVCDVEGVTFRINGQSDIMFRGEISLEQIFYEDPSLNLESDTISPKDAATGKEVSAEKEPSAEKEASPDDEEAPGKEVSDREETPM